MGKVIPMGQGKRVAESPPPMEHAAPELDSIPLEDHEPQSSNLEIFQISSHHRRSSANSDEADLEIESEIFPGEQPEDPASPIPIPDTIESIDPLEQWTELPPESDPSPAFKRIEIDIDTYNWDEVYTTNQKTNGNRLIHHWLQQIENISNQISHAENKEQCGRECIAKTYMQLFFPEIKRENEEYKSKVKQIEQMLANGGSGPVDHQMFSNEGFEDTIFFNQVVGPLRQLIAFTIEQKVLPADDEAVQDFFGKLMIFNALIQRTIATVTDLRDMDHFGVPCQNLEEPFCQTLSASQGSFILWSTSDNYPPKPSDCEEDGDYEEDGDHEEVNIWSEEGQYNVLGGRAFHGSVNHSYYSMLFIGGDLFGECIETAKCLKDNPQDPEMFASFTLAMKKFMYVGSHSSICQKGQAATLKMFVDSMAQYAGLRLERFQISDDIKEVLQNLTKEYSGNDRDYRQTWGFNGKKNTDEEFLEEFYHVNIFALYMDSFGKFDERYPCTFKSINPEMDDESILQQIFQPETQPLAAPVDAISPVQSPESPQGLASPPAVARTRIDVDHHNWNLEQVSNVYRQNKKKGFTFQLESQELMTADIQEQIQSASNKEACGRRCIAEVYVHSFFPEITQKSQYESKIAEVEQILANEGNEQIDHRKLFTGLYGDEGFFNQTAAPLRQLLADAFEHQVLDTDNDWEVRNFFEKIIQFSAIARGAIAAVTNSKNMEKFGMRIEPQYGSLRFFQEQFEENDIPYEESMLYPLHPQTSDDVENLKTQLRYDRSDQLLGLVKCIGEPFHITFSESQIYLARWLASDPDPSNPNQWDALKLGQLTNDSYQKESSFGCTVDGNGHVHHNSLNMLYVGNGIFKECMEGAKRLKEDPNDPEALAAFTQAIKKFMYTWSQSSTYSRGQAAMLMMFVDSIAKYAGFQLKRPEVPEETRTALAQLTERFPDRDKVEGDETETSYPVPIEKEGELISWERKKDEKWLQDLYYHYDVLALLMPSFEVFDKQYQCEFVPSPRNEPPAGDS
jgi:hypothetical protein